MVMPISVANSCDRVGLPECESGPASGDLHQRLWPPHACRLLEEVGCVCVWVWVCLCVGVLVGMHLKGRRGRGEREEHV